LRYSIEFIFLLSYSTRVPMGDRKRATEEVLQYMPLKKRMLVRAELGGFGGSMLALFTNLFYR